MLFKKNNYESQMSQGLFAIPFFTCLQIICYYLFFLFFLFIFFLLNVYKV